jgi:hypothetical protein
MATRATTSEPWSAPMRIDSLGAANADGKISLSFDGRELYFASYNTSWNPVTVGQNQHLWVATRERLRGPKK